MLQTNCLRKDDVGAFCLTVNWKRREKKLRLRLKGKRERERKKQRENEKSRTKNFKPVTSTLPSTSVRWISRMSKGGQSLPVRHDHHRNKREQRFYGFVYVNLKWTFCTHLFTARNMFKWIWALSTCKILLAWQCTSSNALYHQLCATVLCCIPGIHRVNIANVISKEYTSE